MTNVVAMPAPSAKVRPSASAGVITSPSVSAASAATERSIQLCDAIAKRLRSTMSAIDPIRSASSTAGTLLAVWTSAISVGESDSDAITVTAPTVFIQITSCEPASAVHAARKPGRRSGASADSSAGAACWGGGAASVKGFAVRDVARVAGVHPATVSRALNEETRALVNEETARRVLKAAEQLGYQPNPIARGLKTNRSYTIGVLIPDLTNPLFPPILRGIEDRLATDGYTPLTANTDNDPERELLDSQTMRARQVDGIIAATARRDHRLHDALLEAGIELVLVNRRQAELPVSSATADDRMGMRLAVGHPVSLGHTRIAHLAGPLDYSTGLDRHDSFHDTMRRAGLEPDPELVLVAEAFTESEGARLCGQLMADGRRFTAVAAANDLLALGCYDVFADRGVR